MSGQALPPGQQAHQQQAAVAVDSNPHSVPQYQVSDAGRFVLCVCVCGASLSIVLIPIREEICSRDNEKIDI